MIVYSKTSKKIAHNSLIKLKTSNKFREHVCNLVEYHDFLPHKISKKTYLKYIGRLGTDVIHELFDVRKADVSAQNPIFLAECLEQNEEGKKMLEIIESENACFKISDLAINGSDLINHGVPSSPEIGRILSILLDEVMDEKLINNKNALLSRALELMNAERGSK